MKISLVLGGGGARGYAHIGAIRELTARGHEIASISSCSMGAIVGGVYAAGKMDEFEERVRGIERSHVLWYLDVALRGPGMLKADRVMDMLAELVGDVEIQDLPIPFVAVAVDLAARREVWFPKGPLLTAIRASIAIPTAITPIVMNGRLLADGGLLNPLPIEPTAMVHSDAVVAVSLMGRDPHQSASTVSDAEEEPALRIPGAALAGAVGDAVGGAVEGAVDGVMGIFEKVTGRANGVEEGEDPEPEDPRDEKRRIARLGRSPEPLPRGLTTIDMMTMALNTMQASIESTRSAASPPDVLVSIPTGAAGTFDFHRAEELIELGQEATAAELDRAGF
ncbi:MAG: patatin-like phospholipase family protein [bacterium]|nr:patatin-like phospholipase family protein [bacterium]